MLIPLLLALPLAPGPGQVWIVDEHGPADFASIAEAIPLVSAGDVLLVQPGTYGSFNLDKSLSILAPAGLPRPVVQGTSHVSGASECSFVGLQIEALDLFAVPGRVVIDDCTIGPPSTLVALKADQCAQMLVTRTTVKGFIESYGDSYCAVRVTQTEAAFVQCDLAGGYGPFGEDWNFSGGTGLRVDSSVATVAGTNVAGGKGGEEYGAIGCASGCGGPGGHAIWATNSDLFIRGASSNVIKGGHAPFGNASDGYSIRAEDSLVVVSSVSLVGDMATTGSSVVLTPDPAEPFLLVKGDDPTGLRRILVFGPEGDPVLVALSLKPSLVPLPSLVEGDLWFDPFQILATLPLTTEGQDHPATLLIPIPYVPELVGLMAIAQALFPNFPGTLDPTVPLLTNAGQMVLH